MQPLLRIFDPILKNASSELLHGSHTRAISISTPSNSGIMRFAKKQLSCVGCKALISNKDQTLCSHCKGREAELYCKTVDNGMKTKTKTKTIKNATVFWRNSPFVSIIVSELEKLFGRLWTQCQECQGSLHQDVLCTRYLLHFPYSYCSYIYIRVCIWWVYHGAPSYFEDNK